eukprot:scaffold24737_cov80-Skeletonema_marinoi.AAC.3
MRCNITSRRYSASAKKEEHRGLNDASISHLQGRPDLESIIKTAFESARDEETDIDIFMCGPSSLTAAASRAIRREEKRGRCVANPLSLSHEPRAYSSKKKKCSISQCTKQAKVGGLCMKHGGKVKYRFCNAPHCSNVTQKGGYCKRHFNILIEGVGASGEGGSNKKRRLSEAAATEGRRE